MVTPGSYLDHIAFLIRRSAAFPAADDDFIRSLAEVVVWSSVPGGAPLFRQGDASEAMYIVVSGLLGAYVGGSGDERMVGRIGPGELVGEMGCLTGEPRSATVRALRASEVLAISHVALESLARRHPVVLLSLSRTVIGRLRHAQEGKPTTSRPRTYCLVPQAGEGDHARAFAADFTAAMATLGSTVLVTRDNGHDQTADGLSALEAAHDFVVYVAERGPTAWTRLCLRQADTVLIVARGEDQPRPIESFREMINPGIPVDLALLWPGRILPGKTAAWLDALHPRGQFHVRARPDVERAARLLTGKGLGLVLSGGGARGLAHVGVARALAERSIPVDAICGTSMGSLVGGLLAMEQDFATMRRRADAFSRRHPLRDLTMPRVSLLSGRGLKASLEEWFGEWGIEDTPIRFACVSANLNTGAAHVHLRGKLKTGIRASAALPGVFPPVIDNDVVHVDGGIVNNLPVDVIRGMGVGFVVAVDVGAVALPTAAPGIIEILMRAGTMNSEAHVLMLRQQCDLLLIPDVQHLSLMNWRAYDKAFEIGYRCALDQIDRIERRIREIRVSSAPGALNF
jgi:NTE family protein